MCLERRYTPSSEQDAKCSAKHPKTLFAEKKNTYPLHTGDAVRSKAFKYSKEIAYYINNVATVQS